MPPENPDYISSVSLMILGESLNPSVVSRILGLEPDKFWSKGDPKQIGESLHEWGGWRQKLPDSLKRKPFEEQLRYWAQELLARIPGIQELSGAGNRCLLDCFLTTGEVAHILLSSELQREVANLGLEFEFNVWAGQNEG
ncbi:DUF4279 domain-containing protein [Roseateles oligotrophus]|uniref:DUF4279 domain-containing protein n=1 Tax=Roseateles oligotrophus TaxID=1769250 RepID=A0ABT2Y853_9BURK|nr:DUF4279 domain-containing protein [Roseateles oligotrophus]MCV2366487.1 DUF4279 domain-containing protein [Roseateles oligotrophus]